MSKKNGIRSGDQPDPDPQRCARLVKKVHVIFSAYGYQYSTTLISLKKFCMKSFLHTDIIIKEI
jgi:hypothetical protein